MVRIHPPPPAFAPAPGWGARLGGLLKRLSLALILILPQAPAAWAQDAPQPPCEAAPFPPYPDLADAGAAPEVRVWSGEDLPARWPAGALPAGCADWPEQDYEVVVALAGIVRTEGGVEDLLARFAAVSETRGIRYWSATAHAWRVLIEDASALAGPDLEQRRPDFTMDEMRSGEDLYFAQKDNRSSRPVVYRMRVRTIAPDRLVVSMENASDVRAMLMTLFEPGELQSTYFLERLAPDAWGYYQLGGAAEAAPLAAALVNRSSYVNRAVALYRHVAGVPTDLEPPPVR